MGRPLTAADRMPEVGDVLVMVVGYRSMPRAVLQTRADDPDVIWLDGIVAKPIVATRASFNVLHYVSRADGGAVTIDD